MASRRSSAPPICKLCGKPHGLGEPHIFDGSKKPLAPVDEVEAPLTPDERERFGYHMGVITRAFSKFLKHFEAEAGESMRIIRDERLYRVRFKTFEDFCQDTFGHPRSWANRLITKTTPATISAGAFGSKIDESDSKNDPNVLTPTDNKDHIGEHGDTLTGTASEAVVVSPPASPPHEDVQETNEASGESVPADPTEPPPATVISPAPSPDHSPQGFRPLSPEDIGRTDIRGVNIGGVPHVPVDFDYSHNPEATDLDADDDPTPGQGDVGWESYTDPNDALAELEAELQADPTGMRKLLDDASIAFADAVDLLEDGSVVAELTLPQRKALSDDCEKLSRVALFLYSKLAPGQ